jgi:hypothetical protein
MALSVNAKANRDRPTVGMRVRLSSLLTLAILLLATSPSSGAGQHQWGAAYMDWEGVELSRTSSISQTITPLETSNYTYWSINWRWDGRSNGAYAGVQTGGQRGPGVEGDIGIFSIWDAKEAVPGPKSWCLPFGGEGVGMSCRTNLKIEAAGLYKVVVFPDSSRGKEWWGAEMVTPNQESILLGYIKAPFENLRASRLGNFTEYFGSQLPCDGVGLASARFGIPNSSGKVKATSVKFSRPLEGCVNSWMELDKDWGTQGPILRFGGNAKTPQSSLAFASVPQPTTTPTATPTATAKPAPKPVKYKNCTALNVVYPGGVAKSASSKNKGGKIRLAQVVNSKLYDLNKSLDRDKDGLACER